MHGMRSPKSRRACCFVKSLFLQKEFNVLSHHQTQLAGRIWGSGVSGWPGSTAATATTSVIEVVALCRRHARAGDHRAVHHYGPLSHAG